MRIKGKRVPDYLKRIRKSTLFVSLLVLSILLFSYFSSAGNEGFDGDYQNIPPAPAGASSFRDTKNPDDNLLNSLSFGGEETEDYRPKLEDVKALVGSTCVKLTSVAPVASTDPETGVIRTELSIQIQDKYSCSAADALGDVFLYSAIYNASDPYKDPGAIVNEISGFCTSLRPDVPDSSWGSWQALPDTVHVFRPLSNSDETIVTVLCGWTGPANICEENDDGECVTPWGVDSHGFNKPEDNCDDNKIWMLPYRVSSLKLESASVLSSAGSLVPCSTPGAIHKGGYYSPALQKSYALCMKPVDKYYMFYDEDHDVPGLVWNTDEYCYAIIGSQAVCDNDGVCTQEELYVGGCDDCSPCVSRSSSYSDPMLEDDIIACQGDLNPGSMYSRNGKCKWCPVPYEPDQPIVHARGVEAAPFGDGISFPYLLPEKSYSTSADRSARSGCVDVKIGDPFNCGLCGWGEEITSLSQLQRGNELTSGFCFDSVGAGGAPDKNAPYCVQKGFETGIWKCVNEDDPDYYQAIESPWFATYTDYVNPYYFYDVEYDGQGGYRSVPKDFEGEPLSYIDGIVGGSGGAGGAGGAGTCTGMCVQTGQDTSGCQVRINNCGVGYLPSLQSGGCFVGQPCSCTCQSSGAPPPDPGTTTSDGTAQINEIPAEGTGYSYGNAVDWEEYACEMQTGGTFELKEVGSKGSLQCCGGGKLRESGETNCEATRLCDGDHWHDSYDSSQEGEVFYLPEEAALPYPIANIGVGEKLIMCVDTVDLLTVSRLGCNPPPNGAGGGGDGCVPSIYYQEDLDELCEGCASECLATEDKADPGKSGEMRDYMCPADYYHALSNGVPGAGSICRMTGTHNRLGLLDYTAEGVMFCQADYIDANEPQDIWGHGYLIDADVSKSFPFDEAGSAGSGGPIPDPGTGDPDGFTAASATSARCPSAIAWPWLAPGFGLLSNITILPCPGTLPISVVNENFYVGPFGSRDGKAAGVCFPRLPDEPLYKFGEMFKNLDYVAADIPTVVTPYNKSVAGSHQYLCTMDKTLPEGDETTSNAFFAICCGQDGCEDIPGEVQEGAGRYFFPGQYVEINFSHVWDDGSIHYDTYHKLYCDSFGNWTMDLDYDKDSCAGQAGEHWTGSKCCSEGGDEDHALSYDLAANEYYADPGGNGVCFYSDYVANKRFLNNNFAAEAVKSTSSSSPAGAQSVWVGGGAYYGCSGDKWQSGQDYGFPKANFLLINDSYRWPDNPVTNAYLGYRYGPSPQSGYLLPNSLPGVDVAFSTQSNKILAVWSSQDTVEDVEALSFEGRGIQGNFYSVAGEKLLSNEIIFTPEKKPLSGLKVSYDPDDDLFLVLWSWTGEGVMGSLLKADGSFVKRQFSVISGQCSLGDVNSSFGNVDYMSGEGKFIVSCTQMSHKIGPVVGAMISKDGVVSAPFNVGTGYHSSVAAGTDKFLVTWTSSSGVFGRLFNPDGSPLGGEVQIAPNTTKKGIGFYNSAEDAFDLFYVDADMISKRRIFLNGSLGNVTKEPLLWVRNIIDGEYFPSRNSYFFTFPSNNTYGGLSLAEFSSDGKVKGAFDVSDASYTFNNESWFGFTTSLSGVRFPYGSIADVNSIPFTAFLRDDSSSPGQSERFVGPFGQFGAFAGVSATWYQPLAQVNISNPFTDEGLMSVPTQLINYELMCTQIDLPGAGSRFCDIDGNWKKPGAGGSSGDRSHFSAVPSDLLRYMNTLSTNGSLVPMACCSPNQCWDALKGKCINEQTDFNDFYRIPETNATYKCQDGSWGRLGAERYTPDRCQSGYCPVDGQCLLNPNGNPLQNGNLSSDANPQCLNSGQFLNDDYCLNGSWSSRTRLAALTLSKLVESEQDDFTLFCGAPEDIFIREQNPGKINSVCVLDFRPGEVNNQRIFATSLNQEFELPENETNIGRDYWYAIRQSFWLAYPGADLNSTCKTESGYEYPCVKGNVKGYPNAKLLNMYLDNDTGIIIFSDKQISNLQSDFGDWLCDTLPPWLGWFCAGPPTLSKSITNLTFTSLYSVRFGNKESLGVGRKICECDTCPKQTNFVFDYLGYTSDDLAPFLGDASLRSSLASEFNVSDIGSNLVRVKARNPLVEPEDLWNVLSFVKRES
ncbi:hypothetical protein JW711_00130 [Candidatus Woesearchaeota archaeon]|nr:hypothetical protein [Candidatus Woesearchaeota archaeon]